MTCSRVTAATPERYLEKHEVKAVALHGPDALCARAVVFVHVDAAAAAATGHAAERKRRVTESRVRTKLGCKIAKRRGMHARAAADSRQAAEVAWDEW